VHVGARYSARLRWRAIDAAFKSRILIGAVINSKHFESHNFFVKSKEIVLDRVNTAFNVKFWRVTKMRIKVLPREFFHSTDLRERYELRIVEPILVLLEEFQERDSGWALSRILNLTINVKYNPLHAGCQIQLLREIKIKRAIVNVQSRDNAYFTWSVVAALRPAESHIERESSYPHYTTVLDLKDIEFPMTLNQIKKFENQNNVSINAYCIEKKKELSILPIRLTNQKMNEYVNLLYIQDDNKRHETFRMDKKICLALSAHNLIDILIN